MTNHASALLAPVDRGYFTGRNGSSNFGPVIANCNGSDPITSAMANKALFIATILQYYSNGKVSGDCTNNYDVTRNKIGARFIIQTMRGVAGDIAPLPTAANITDWQNRINSNTVTITWQAISFNINSGYMGQTSPQTANDDAFWSDPGGASTGLVFRVNGVTSYILKFNCGNPVGDLPGLPVPAGWSLQPLSSVSPTTANIGQSVTFFNAVKNIGPLTANFTYIIRREIVPPPGNGSAYWTPVAGPTAASQGVSTQDYPNPPGTGAAFTIPATILLTTGATVPTPAGTQFCDQIEVTPLTSSSAPGYIGSNPACVTVTVPPVSCAGGTAVVTGSNNYVQPSEPTTLTFTLQPPTSGSDRIVTYTIQDSSGGTVSGPTTKIRATQLTASVALPATVFPAADDYKVIWSVEATGGSCANGNVSVVGLPFFSAYGASIRAGGDFATANPGCTGGGELYSWHNNLSGNNYGTGSQLAAIALIKIVGVASAQTYAPPDPVSPSTALSFANSNPVDISNSGDSPGLGGIYEMSHCFIDPPTPIVASSDTTFADIKAMASGTYYFKGPQVSSNGLTIGGGNGDPPFSYIAAGKHITIYVEGNVFLNTGIAYNAPNSWASITDIPSVNVEAVGGNMYIDDGVAQLDGVYIARNVALPATKGIIFDCSKQGQINGLEQPFELYNKCNQPLVIHGSFVADKINLMRTYGTIHDITNPYTDLTSCSNNWSKTVNNPHTDILPVYSSCGAEVFDFSPEMYLTNLNSSSGSATQYDSITSLPPIL